MRDVKKAAVLRWVNAVNADGQFGHWQYAMCGLKQVKQFIDEAVGVGKIAT